MWRRPGCLRTNFPVPVTLNLAATALFDFIFGTAFTPNPFAKFFHHLLLSSLLQGQAQPINCDLASLPAIQEMLYRTGPRISVGRRADQIQDGASHDH